ncbi:hypothetical protein C8R44DRAFT_242721 [Mycena epipterygia]|nr:hypothetical protein C8R44DRAFT_242721 [Mycena epipterygia]
MSSYIFSSFSCLPSSKETPRLFWCLVAVIHSLFVVLAPAVEDAVSAIATVNGLGATPTVIILPSRCTPSPNKVSFPYWMVAFLYFSLVSIILFPFLHSKGFFSNGPPNPGPDPAPTPAGVPRPFPPDGHNHIAADGVPPPPPPGNDSTSDASERRARRFGLWDWILWVIFQALRLLKILFLAPFKIIAPFCWLIIQYIALPMVVLRSSHASGLIPVMASYSGPYIFKAVKFSIDSSRITQIMTLLGIWCCLYPFFAFGRALLVDLEPLPAAIARFLSLSWRCIVWTIKKAIRCTNASRRRLHAWHFKRLALGILILGSPIMVLEWVPDFLDMLGLPFHLRLWYYYKVTVPYNNNIRKLVLEFYHSQFLPRCNLVCPGSILALRSYCSILRNSPAVAKLVRRLCSPLRQIVFYWDWVIAPTMAMLSARELGAMLLPPLVYVVVDYVDSPARHMRAANKRLETRIQALEAQLQQIGGHVPGQ